MTTTVNFNNCGAYLTLGYCDPTYWDGNNFIAPVLGSGGLAIDFIDDDARDPAFPPYTLTSLRVVAEVVGGTSHFKRIDVYRGPGWTNRIYGADDTLDHTFYFDPPLSSNELLGHIYIITDGDYPIRVTLIEATGTFPGVLPECVSCWTSYIDTTEECQEV